MDKLSEKHINLQKGYVEERNIEISEKNKGIIKGLEDNKIKFSLENIKEQQTIVYLGDSITQGFYSNGKLSEEGQGYRTIVDEALKSVNKFNKSYNFAVGGFTISDAENILYNDLTINDINEIIYKTKELTEKLKEQYSYNQSINPSFSEAVENSTILITSIGFNDILPFMGDIWDMEKLNIDFEGLFKTVKRVRLQKEVLFKQILKINPEIKIFELEGYIPQTKLSDDAMDILYSLYKYISKHIIIDDIKNVKTVKLVENIQAKHLEYIDNTHDAHPNIEGYKIIANKVLRTLNDNLNKK